MLYLSVSKRACCLLLLLLSICLPPQVACTAEIAIYGASGGSGIGRTLEYLGNTGVTSVFTAAKKESIEVFNKKQFKVYLTLNVFGGKQPWTTYPDSIPVTADGTLLSAASGGGICPTHPQWRKSRLALLERWLTDFNTDKGISGIWLDFIRYPGRWEHDFSPLPDTCYCPRCLALFGDEKGVQLPGGLSSAEASVWIKANAQLKWVAWKKEQIVSFVRDARRLVDRYSRDRQLLLGAFVVPWKKSDYNGAVSFRLAQDAQLLAPYLDVLSPMLYHKMVGESVAWICLTTEYFAELAGIPVWPIIQAESVAKDEFGRVLQGLSESKATGLLIYSFRYMGEDQWPLLKDFVPKKSLIGNPQLKSGADTPGTVGANVEGARIPRDWMRGPVAAIQDSAFWFDKLDSKNNHAIGLTAGQDRMAYWQTPLEACVPGQKYQFSADFFRHNRGEPQAYPEIAIWGQKYRLNTHRIVEYWQRLKASVTCPDTLPQKNNIFRFKNNYPATTFWMRSPRLVRESSLGQSLKRVPVEANFFPLGVYGANSKNLGSIKEIGLNTAVVALSRENVEKCLQLNMRCTFSVPRTPEKLFIALEKFGPLLERGDFSYYVNDEPGIHSFSESIARDLYDIIKARYPKAVTGMAIVRPQAIPYYEQGADFFMLDQYPVPHMPMTWLSDSMDEAAEYVGKGRLQSVIQAFGGVKFTTSGWPRRPTFAEMNCLSFLSVIHGSRGIYFYTYPSVTATQQGKEDFSRLIRRLNSMRSWLLVKNDNKPVSVEMTSQYNVDPSGKAAVHCTRKEQFGTQMLICVSTINTYTEAKIGIVEGQQSPWAEYYTGAPYTVVEGTIKARFGPYEVKVLLEGK